MQYKKLSKDLTHTPNETVKYLQTRLCDWGLLNKNQVDGIFGDITENAVKTFQKEVNLKPNGIVDENTWELIEIPSTEKETSVTASVEKDDMTEAIKLITMFEGLSLKAYKDPGSRNGLPITIGYGSTKKKDGSNFKLGDRLVNKQEAYDLLIYKLETEFVPKLRETIPHWEKLNNNQRNALISFAYNCGASFYGTSGFKTISEYLENKMYKMIPQAMMLYVKGANGKKLQGLVNRRQLEGQLFSKI